MGESVVPPSPCWYLSGILACSDDGTTLAYGARHELVVLRLLSPSATFIPMAHKERVTGVALPGPNSVYQEHVVSCSDDGSVRLWNYSSQTLRFNHSGHPEGHKTAGVAWSRADGCLVVSVSDMGSIVCWDLGSNTVRRLYAGARVLPVCVACSPHDKHVIAIGAKQGLVLLYSVKGEGEQLFRLRGHETDVVSLAFCPVQHNVFRTNSTEKVKLLVSGSKDRSVHFWKTGTDGRLEFSIQLPQAPMSGQRSRNGSLMGTSGSSWISVCWPQEKTVLTSSLFGELLSYDLTHLTLPTKGGDGMKKKAKPTLVHGLHSKALFCIAASGSSEADKETKVWTTALDKRIVCAQLGKTPQVLCNLTTVGGIVYCMAPSPLDPYRIAIGTGDNKIMIWNLRAQQSEAMQMYWNKINSKVMALAWHPVEEQLLAFGTGEGRVGLMEVSSNRAPTLLRLYHRKCVYSLIWAPTVIRNDGEDLKLSLFSVGDGEVVQFNPDIPDREPESLSELLAKCDAASSMNKQLIRTDLAFNHDKSLAAVGNENGCVYIVGGDKFDYVHTIFAHKKLVQCLCWHPATVTSQDGRSQCATWLASASDNVQIVSVTRQGVETIRTLSEHCEKVVSLMWSPHINGRLITASYDYTSQVWDVVEGRLVSWLEGHHGAVVSCLLSPVDPDQAITGSADYTIRVWNLNDHSQLPVSTTSSKNRKQRMQGVKVKFEGAEEATELNPQDGSEYKSVKSISGEVSGGGKEKGETDKSNKRRGASMFPVTSASMASAKHIHTLWTRLRDHPDDAHRPPPPANASLEDTCYLDFFGDQNSVRRLLAVEESHHMANGNLQNAMHASLWTGEISELIYQAMKKKQLTDWLVSLAPLVSHKLWRECCSSYADQLMESGGDGSAAGLKAAGYLLAVHRVEDAVDCLISCKLVREAVVLAKCRLPEKDPLVEKAMRAWLSHCLQYGQHILAAHCLLSLGDKMGCVDLLSRSKDARVLSLASDIAASEQSQDLAAIVAARSVSLSLDKQDFDAVQATLVLHPHLRELKLWGEVCRLLHEEPRLDNEGGLEWLLKGRLEESDQSATPVSGLFKACTDLASSLQPLSQTTLAKYIPTSPDYSSETAVWLYIGGQLSVAGLLYVEERWEEAVDQVVRALNAAYAYQSYQRVSDKVFLQLTPFLFPSGGCCRREEWVSCLGIGRGAVGENVLRKVEQHVSCCGVYWLEYLLTHNHLRLAAQQEESRYSQPLNCILDMVSTTVLDPSTLNYFTDEVKIKNLEKKCAVAKLESRMTKNSKGGSPEKDSSKDLKTTKDSNSDTDSSTKATEKDSSLESRSNGTESSGEREGLECVQATLEELRARKAAFEAAHCPTVNPFVVYCCVKDVLQQLTSRSENPFYKDALDRMHSRWQLIST